MQQIKSFGCSFVYGSDLPDAQVPRLHTARAGGFHTTASQLTWPALLAHDLDCEYQCYARPGSGNLQILNTVLNHVEHNDDSVFVIGWTWIDRFDYTNHNDDWVTALPGDNQNISQMYYRYLHSQYRDKLTALTYIATAVGALQQHRRRFVMTYMDDLLLEKEWHATSATDLLQQQIAPALTDFQGQTFLNWSRQQGFSIGDQLHPGVDAHRAAFEYLQGQNLFS